MSFRWGRRLGAAIALAVLAAPAAGQQFSDRLTFIKAVKERDFSKTHALISAPGNVALNTRELGSGDGGLHIVSRDKDFQWLRLLLHWGARPDLQNNKNETALTIASQLGWTEGVKLLLQKRASVDLANSRGETPLILAVQNRHTETVRVLVGAGADPNRSDSVQGYSALDYAKRDPRLGSILKLLQAPRASAKPASAPIK